MILNFFSFLPLNFLSEREVGWGESKGVRPLYIRLLGFYLDPHELDDIV